jgi:hypothetical protein
MLGEPNESVRLVEFVTSGMDTVTDGLHLLTGLSASGDAARADATLLETVLSLIAGIRRPARLAGVPRPSACTA